MKINVISDLHLDFADLTLPGGDVLILSGDICEAKHLKQDLYKTPAFVAAHPDLMKTILVEGGRPERRIDRYARFFNEECSKYREVVMVMGNHEHYGYNYQKTYAHIAANLPSNVTLLENQTHQIDDVIFVGATLWTDMNKADPLTMFHMKSAMNDYKQITQFNEAKNVYHRLDPARTVSDHYASRQFIAETVKDQFAQKFVVVTHHAPSKASTKPQYVGDTLMNGAYSSDLSEFILENPQIKLWTHGHTHDVFDYMIGSTRIVCNPRGYKNYEDRAEMFKADEFEIEL